MVLDGVDFLPGHLPTSRDILAGGSGGQCYWHLVSRGQGYH